MKHLTTIIAAVLCAVCLSGCDSDLETRREKQRKKYNSIVPLNLNIRDINTYTLAMRVGRRLE